MHVQQTDQTESSTPIQQEYEAFGQATCAEIVSAPTTANRLTRRTFLRAMAASAGVLAVGGTTAGSLLAANGGGGGGGSRMALSNPLYIPGTVSPSGLTLTAEAGTATIGGVANSSVWAYNGTAPAPTIVATRGNSASVQLINRLAQETTIHWHGMIVPEAADGHPMHTVAPGSSYLYQFTVNQRACLNWYHPHPHKCTGEQVYKGLAGAFIIRDGEEAALGLPAGPYEVPLILRDATFDVLGNLSFSMSSPFLGKVPLANGTRDAYLNVDRALYRFRVLNGCNGRVFRLALSNGAPLTLIGNDGGLLERSIQINEITLAPAERLDLLIDFSALSQGATVTLRCLDAGWDLLQFRGTGVGSGGAAIPTTLSSIVPLGSPATTRDFSFDGMSGINRQSYRMSRIDFTVPFGQTELWRFRATSNGPHPVHVHGASFQVQSRSGGRGQVFPWERGWKDTVLLQNCETVEILIRFDQYRGSYLLHCHQLSHEDHGMMANFQVI